MREPKLKKYLLYVELTVVGESPEDALDYAISAIDNSDLLDEDGIVGINVVDDVDSILPVKDEEQDDEHKLAGNDEEDY